MALTGPVSTTIPPTDRLSLLPKELLDKIYSLVLQSDTSPWTLYIKTILQPSKHAGYSRPDPDPIPSILALPQDCKNKALRRESPNAKWPDSVEEAFLRALSWTYDHRPNEEGMFPYYDKTIWEIIYELTGIRRRQRIIPSHIQVLKDFLHPSIPESKHILPTISESISALRHLNVSNDTFEIVKTITVIQNSLPKLQSAFQSEHDTAIPTPPEPISTDISSSPTTTPHPGISRTPSTIISNPGSAPYLSLSLHPPSPSNLLSLTLVNHFHRTHALSVLASILIFDFSDNIEAIYALHTPFTSQYIKLINLLFVEGYMPLPIVSHLLAHGSNSTLLPSLRELSIKIWPRDPTREDRGDIRWGGQTHELLQTLRGFREGTVKVVVGFRLESDCGRFEEGYVGWRRRRWGVDGKDRGQVEGGSVCRRFYELERN